MVTQAQIAKRLGVSRQLVTFALSGHPHVAKASRELIIATAKEMGYRPNLHARALKKKRSGIIGLWIPDQISTHYNHVSRELSRFLKQDGYELMVSEIANVDMSHAVSNVPVDGIIAVDASEPVQRELEILSGKSVALVGIGHCFSENADNISVDLATGTIDVMKHLIGNGYRRIAHATFVEDVTEGDGRRSEYARAMLEAGLEPMFFQYPLSEGQRAITRQLIKEFISENGLPEAIFCHSDDAALGIYRGLCDLKICVPEQVALVGCDGIEDTEYLEVPLTTLVQPVPEMCAKAWTFLRERIENPSLPARHETLFPKLEIRASSSRSN